MLYNKFLARKKLIHFAGYVDMDFARQYELPHAQYVLNVLQDAMDGTLWEEMEGEGKRILILTMPPGHYKSSCVQKAVAWYIGDRFKRKLPHQVAYISYSAALAESASRAVRETFEEENYQRTFSGVSVDPDARKLERWGLLGEKLHTFLATGVGGPLTGFRAHLMVIDDPIKDAAEANSEASREAKWEWWTKVAQTRLTKHSIVVVILTRWHDDDLAGKLLKQEHQEPGTYRIKLVRIPAIAESDETRKEMANVLYLPEVEPSDPLGRAAGEALCDEIATPGELAAIQKSDREGFACLFQGAPRPEGGYLLGRCVFRHLVVPPETGNIRWVIGTDWAITEKQTAPKRRNDPDYTAAALFGVWQEDADDVLRVRMVLAAVERIQAEPSGAKRMLRKFAAKVERKIGHRVPIAAGQDNIDKVILNDMRQHPKMLMWEIINLPRDKMRGDKVVRSAGWRSRATNELFYVVDEAWWGKPWHDQFFEEVEGFPRKTHDDMVDAVSVGAAYLTEADHGGENLPFSLRDVTPQEWQRFMKQRRMQLA